MGRTENRAGLTRLDAGQVCMRAERKAGWGGAQEHRRKHRTENPEPNPLHIKPTCIETPQNTHEYNSKYTSNTSTALIRNKQKSKKPLLIIEYELCEYRQE